MALTVEQPHTEVFRRQEQRWWGYLLLCLYAVFILLLVFLAHFTRPDGISGFPGLARALALTGFSILALQVILGSRLKFIDRPWGLDKIMRFHKWAGSAAFALLLLHPLMLLIAYTHEMGLDLNTASSMLGGVYSGIITLLLLFLVVFFALFIRKLGLNYQHWRNKHKFSTIAVVILGFIHGVRVGPAMPGLMSAYFWGLFIAVIGIYLFRNIYMVFFGRSRWEVASVTSETHDTYTLALQPLESDIPFYRPGQFIFLRLNRPGRASEEHPFTISSSPSAAPLLTVTIKESGDFTNTISQTRPGDTALIDGPFGRFSYQHDSPESFIFIAGGVGITPILSMVRYLRDTHDKRQAIVFCANRTEKDIIRRSELDAMPENITVYHALQYQPDGWDGYTGYLNGEIIKEGTADCLTTAHIYLCGPPPMMDALTKELRALEVPAGRIHSERFSL